MERERKSHLVERRNQSGDRRSNPGDQERVSQSGFRKQDRHAGEYTTFVDNLSRRVSRRSLWEVFTHYGEVMRVFIPLRNNRPRYKDATFAFVRFKNQVDLDKAILKINSSKIDGKVVRVSKAKYALGHFGRVSSRPFKSGGVCMHISSSKFLFRNAFLMSS
ncbi:hypothetical protein V6N13_020080 [Hibiscus sabdariffa]|uniref:RRM domain-containing protein n=1 Tax=Hibiscus sabdariffa TaxID=183260 RepID=A0ABR2ESF6_9ROSI